MKIRLNKNQRGNTLMESVISMGVLAIAVPLVYAAIGESGQTSQASGAETRAPWIVSACFDELRAAAHGRSGYFTADDEGRVVPPEDAIWALGFTRAGKITGMVPEEQYTAGVRDNASDSVRLIARVHPAPAESDTPSAVSAMRVTIEYPATAPEGRRKTLDFYAHTR